MKKKTRSGSKHHWQSTDSFIFHITTTQANRLFFPLLFFHLSSRGSLFFLSSFCLVTLSHSPTCVWSTTWNTAHPEEDVLGRVEACGVDACSVRRRALALDAAGEAGDGALDRLSVCVTLAARHRVRHYKVYGTLCRPTDLANRDGNVFKQV